MRNPVIEREMAKFMYEQDLIKKPTLTIDIEYPSG